jgi:hypothetical protein
MKNTILLILLSLISFTNVNSQILRNQSKEIVSNQGVPTCPGDPKITELINSVGVNNLLNSKKNITKSEANICREIGILLNKRGLYDAADWYLERSKSYVDVVELAPEAVFENPKDDVPEGELPGVNYIDGKLIDYPERFDNTDDTRRMYF